MSDGGSRGSTQLSISLVKPCPDSYTGIRRAEIMLKVEPANHPFVVCMRHVIPGGDDKSDFSAYFVPLYILEGLCLHLAGISGAGEHTFVRLISGRRDSALCGWSNSSMR